jgi:hypothetical protein
MLSVGIDVRFVLEADFEPRSESNKPEFGRTETLSTLPVNANGS